MTTCLFFGEPRSVLELARFVIGLTRVPLRLTFALLQEILVPKWVQFVGRGFKTDYAAMQSAIRQGGLDDSFLLALFAKHHLTIFANSWEALNISFNLGWHKRLVSMRKWIQECIDV